MPPLPRCCPLSLVLLLGSSAAWAGELELESVAQVRHDHFGELYVPAWQLLRFKQDTGPVALQGYAGFEWMAGVPAPLDPDIYHLSAAGQFASGAWALGRQRGLGALRSQTFDGVSYQHMLGERLLAGAWVGMTRHQDVDDLLDFGTMARAELGWSGDLLWLRAGVEGTDGPATSLIARQDLQGLLRLGSGPRAGRFGVRAVVAEPVQEDAGVLVEWARADLAVRPWSPLELSLYGQRRQAADPDSLFGDAILDALAGGVVQEVGAGVRLLGARWSALSMRYALVGYGQASKEQVSHMVRSLLNLEAGLGLDETDALACAICHLHTSATLNRMGLGAGR